MLSLNSSPPIHAAAASTVLHGLPPVTDARTTLLVLGSFPGARSLQMQQYYAHPQNRFWKVMQALWSAHPLPASDGDAGYAQRCDWLLARGVGLWDVYARCTRAGSLDSAIRDAQPNDIAALARQRLPRLAAIACNGGESFRHASRADHAAALGLPIHALPSTSPANAGWRMERLCEAWRAVVAAQGLL